MATTVDALLPLALLEAVRTMDLPEGALQPEDVEYVPELLNKRFGISDTVYIQIKRYSEAVRRNQRIDLAEANGLARLIGRRPDAERVFRSAGRALAHEAYKRVSPLKRRTLRRLPSLLARPVALGATRRIARRFLHGKVVRVGSSMVLQLSQSVTADAAPNSAGCTFYEAMLRELMLLLMGNEGVVEHVRCGQRGEGRCEWRADWRAAASAAP